MNKFIENAPLPCYYWGKSEFWLDDFMKWNKIRVALNLPYERLIIVRIQLWPMDRITKLSCYGRCQTVERSVRLSIAHMFIPATPNGLISTKLHNLYFFVFLFLIPYNYILGLLSIHKGEKRKSYFQNPLAQFQSIFTDFF